MLKVAKNVVRHKSTTSKAHNIATAAGPATVFVQHAYY